MAMDMVRLLDVNKLATELIFFVTKRLLTSKIVTTENSSPICRLSNVVMKYHQLATDYVCR